MDYFSIKYLLWAITLGGLSAVSLPLGSVLGLQKQLKPFYISALAAFGAGALIAGLFLSNFPEALASSANMRFQGWSKKRIFLLWYSLMVITAVGAGAGFVLAESLSHT